MSPWWYSMRSYYVYGTNVLKSSFLIRPLVYFHTKTFILFGSPIFYFYYEPTWWKLFKKRIVRTNFDIHVFITCDEKESFQTDLVYDVFFLYKFVDTTKAIKFNILIFKYVDYSIFPLWQCILFKANYFSF